MKEKHAKTCGTCRWFDYCCLLWCDGKLVEPSETEKQKIIKGKKCPIENPGERFPDDPACPYYKPS